MVMPSQQFEEEAPLLRRAFQAQQHKAPKGHLDQSSGLMRPQEMAQILTGLLRIQHCNLIVSGFI